MRGGSGYETGATLKEVPLSILMTNMHIERRSLSERRSSPKDEEAYLRAHEACYLANSIRGEVVVEPV